MTLTQAEMEARYDAERSGAIYIKPVADYAERFAAGYQAGTAIAEAINAGADDATIAQLVDQALADPIVVERHTTFSDGSIPRDPWMTYAIGDTSIDIQDGGSGNLCIAGECLEFDSAEQLRDLVTLLADRRVLAAIGWQEPTAPLGQAA